MTMLGPLSIALALMVGASGGVQPQGSAAFVPPGCGLAGAVRGGARAAAADRRPALRTAAAAPALCALGMASRKSKGKGKSPSAETPEKTAVPLRSEASVIADVRQAVAAVGNGFDATGHDLDRVAALLGELEDHNEVKNPSRSSRLWGEWRLLFTDSKPMIKNRGVTGLASIPLVSYVDLLQRFDSRGFAETLEVIKTPPFGTRAESSLKGNLTALTGQVIEHSYFDIKLAGGFSAAGESDFSRKTAVLAITYLSEDLRVCRSPSDALFLFERVSAGSVDRL
jgi:hypothetical protein